MKGCSRGSVKVERRDGEGARGGGGLKSNKTDEEEQAKDLHQHDGALKLPHQHQ